MLLQLADACGSYLPAAARETLLAEAGRQASHGTVQSDSQEELEKEMGRNPLEAAAHEASELKPARRPAVATGWWRRRRGPVPSASKLVLQFSIHYQCVPYIPSV